MIEFSCSLSHVQYGIFLPLFLFPYYMRSYRLLTVHTAHHTHFQLKQRKGVFGFKRIKTLYCVRESNLMKVFTVIMLPFVILTILAISYPTFR